MSIKIIPVLLTTAYVVLSPLLLCAWLSDAWKKRHLARFRDLLLGGSRGETTPEDTAAVFYLVMAVLLVPVTVTDWMISGSPTGYEPGFLLSWLYYPAACVWIVAAARSHAYSLGERIRFWSEEAVEKHKYTLHKEVLAWTRNDNGDVIRSDDDITGKYIKLHDGSTWKITDDEYSARYWERFPHFFGTTSCLVDFIVMALLLIPSSGLLGLLFLTHGCHGLSQFGAAYVVNSWWQYSLFAWLRDRERRIKWFSEDGKVVLDAAFVLGPLLLLFVWPRGKTDDPSTLFVEELFSRDYGELMFYLVATFTVLLVLWTLVNVLQKKWRANRVPSGDQSEEEGEAEEEIYEDDIVIVRPATY